MEFWLSLFRSSPRPLLPDTPTPSALPSTTCPEEHDVFLSFRGEDTRNNFTSHLYEALCSKQIETFMDDEELDRGDEISPSLLKAIEKSKLSVIIFSKNYASSQWCLDELVKILESKDKNGQIVIPVFYHVDPSNVRNQCGSYALFTKHWRLIFQGNKDKLQKWKTALTDAANLSGWDSTNIMSEAQLLKRVVQDILVKLNRMSQDGFNFKDLVGIDKHIVKIESLLQTGSSNVCIVGIWGMGGIGKTTIADAVFTKLAPLFKSYYFVANVREQVERFGLNYLRDKYLSHLIEQENPLIGTPSMGSTFVKARLQRTKALVVFDDVDDSSELEHLLGNSGDDCFGPGSRVMVTSRDRQVLLKTVNEIYEVPKMKFQKSRRLFCLHAFKQVKPLKNFKELSKMMVHYCDGIPLALKVLGSFLYGRSKEEWKNVLKKLEETPHKDIQKVLKLSYDGLDDKEKAIFLDITCFFAQPVSLTYLKDILDESEIMGIRVLVDLSLISISHVNDACEVIIVHHLIKKMGQEIIRQQSPVEPGRRSRLWSAKDVCHMLKNNTGTDEVECISLNMSEIKELHCSATTLQMPNLRLFKFYCFDNNDENYPSKVHVSGDLVRFSDRIRLLEWVRYPCKSLDILSLENLVELVLPYSHLEKLWDGVQHIPNLKAMDLRYSKHLTGFPDLSQATNLVFLNFRGCRKLKTFPVISRNIKVLILSNTAIEEVPSSIASLAQLSYLDFSDCESLQNLPCEIGCLSSLEMLSLCGSNIVTIPGIKLLINLVDLNVSDCKRLQSLPDLPPSLVCLEARNCPSLTTMSSPRETISIPESYSYDSFKMDLANCLNLDSYAYDNILGEIGILAKYCSVKQPSSRKSMRVRVPGTEIPKWLFPYRSNGPSLTFKCIPEIWVTMHIVLCVVFSGEDRSVHEVDYRWEIRLGDELTMSSYIFGNDEKRFLEKDHMMITSWYLDRENVFLSPCNSDGYCHATVTIVPQHPDKNIPKVKAIGVNPTLLLGHSRLGKKKIQNRAKRMKRFHWQPRTNIFQSNHHVTLTAVPSHPDKKHPNVGVVLLNPIMLSRHNNNSNQQVEEEENKAKRMKR